SWPLVFRDVSRTYSALESGSAPLLEAATPFRDYVEWLANAAPRSENFWKGQLNGFTTPTPFRLSPVAPAQANGTAGSHFAEMTTTLPADITGALQALVRKEQ